MKKLTIFLISLPLLCVFLNSLITGEYGMPLFYTFFITALLVFITLDFYKAPERRIYWLYFITFILALIFYSTNPNFLETAIEEFKQKEIALDILFVRTFFLVSIMLCLTAVSVKLNRTFETSLELWVTIITSFLILFLLHCYSDTFPLNLVLVAAFSLVMGWQVGPLIEFYGLRYKLRMYLKDKGVILKKGERATIEQRQDFELCFDKDAYHREWQNIVFLTIMGTALAVIFTASLVYFTDIDFSFLESYLFISLILLIIMGLVNAFCIKSKMFSLIRAYLGALVFSLYLLFDFDRLRSSVGDGSWETAIHISVGIYLDIINLFLDLLEILAESG